MRAVPRTTSSPGGRWKSTGSPATATRSTLWVIEKYLSRRTGWRAFARSIAARNSSARNEKMKEHEVRERAFAMPLTSPAFPIGPYRFYHREFFIITYRTDSRKLHEVVPEPLQIDEPLVKFEFIRMPDSTGFGDYTESGQVIPVSFKGRKGGYSHCMFLNDHPPIAGGRELWGFPKKLAEPTLLHF